MSVLLFAGFQPAIEMMKGQGRQHNQRAPPQMLTHWQSEAQVHFLMPTALLYWAAGHDRAATGDDFTSVVANLVIQSCATS